MKTWLSTKPVGSVCRSSPWDTVQRASGWQSGWRTATWRSCTSPNRTSTSSTCTKAACSRSDLLTAVRIHWDVFDLVLQEGSGFFSFSWRVLILCREVVCEHRKRQSAQRLENSVRCQHIPGKCVRTQTACQTLSSFTALVLSSRSPLSLVWCRSCSRRSRPLCWAATSP